MIIPSIDLMGGQTVQLVGGKHKALDAGDPLPIAQHFRLAGEIAVVDLDAALGQGDNRALVERVCRVASCRVGGGIRSLEAALHWLDAGASKIVLGTAAQPPLLSQLPKERVMAALDAVDGEVVVDGWRTRTGQSIEERMAQLKDHVAGFLVTFVEREGRQQGTAMDRVAALVKAAAPARVTIAGGVTTADEVGRIDALGADAQVGMALYTHKMDLADAIVAPLKSDRPDGLWATVVVDTHGRALGLAWSNAHSVREAVRRGQGIYHSRSRGLWVKGESSGATQKLVRVDLDCDRDALRFTVEQAGDGFCHQGTWTCWGPERGVSELARRLAQRAGDAPAGSYTRRLLEDAELLKSKLLEEAGELAAAREPQHVAEEAADVLYFALVACARAGVDLDLVERALDRRALRVTRRPGNAKTGGTVS